MEVDVAAQGQVAQVCPTCGRECLARADARLARSYSLDLDRGRGLGLGRWGLGARQSPRRKSGPMSMSRLRGEVDPERDPAPSRRPIPRPTPIPRLGPRPQPIPRPRLGRRPRHRASQSCSSGYPGARHTNMRVGPYLGLDLDLDADHDPRASLRPIPRPRPRPVETKAPT